MFSLPTLLPHYHHHQHHHHQRRRGTRTRRVLFLLLSLSVSRFSCTAYCKTLSIRPSAPSGPHPLLPPFSLPVESLDPRVNEVDLVGYENVPRRADALFALSTFSGVFFYVANKKVNRFFSYLFDREIYIIYQNRYNILIC